MPGRFTIEVDPERGHVRLGGMRLPVVSAEDGVLRAGNDARVRAVTFAERERLVLDALGDDEPPAALSSLIAARSILDRGELSASVLTALAMALAGGGEETLPLAESARLACAHGGWTWEQALDAPAWLIDRVAIGDAEDDRGWSTIVFASGESSDLEAMTREMAENLLRRHATRSAPPPARATGDVKQGPPAADRRPALTGVSGAAIAPTASRGPGAGDARSANVESSLAPAATSAGTPARQATAGVDSRSVTAGSNSPSAPLRVSSPASNALRTPRSPASESDGVSSPAPVWKAVVGRAPAILRGSGTPLGIEAARTTRASRPSVLPSAATSTRPARESESITGLEVPTGTAPHASRPAQSAASAAPDRPLPAVPPRYWLDHLASALATECDLRGLDR